VGVGVGIDRWTTGRVLKGVASLFSPPPTSDPAYYLHSSSYVLYHTFHNDQAADMGIFLNPFKLYSRDKEIISDVVVPISSAPRYVPGKRRARASSFSLESPLVADSLEYDFASLRAAIAPPAGATHVRVRVDNTPYTRKSRVINLAIQDIGMGPYTWHLFALCGFGWFADNMWLQGLALILTSIQREFGIEDSRIGYTTCALFVGLCCGAVGWGVFSDFWGRKIAVCSPILIPASHLPVARTRIEGRCPRTLEFPPSATRGENTSSSAPG